MECDVMQGHLFSAAMSSRDVTSLLANPASWLRPSR